MENNAESNSSAVEPWFEESHKGRKTDYHVRLLDPFLPAVKEGAISNIDFQLRFIDQILDKHKSAKPELIELVAERCLDYQIFLSRGIICSTYPQAREFCEIMHKKAKLRIDFYRAVYSGETKPKEIAEKASKMPQRLIILIERYLVSDGGEGITPGNKKLVAKKYGYVNPESGQSLYNAYLAHSKPISRFYEIGDSVAMAKKKYEFVSKAHLHLAALRPGFPKALKAAANDLKKWRIHNAGNQ